MSKKSQISDNEPLFSITKRQAKWFIILGLMAIAVGGYQYIRHDTILWTNMQIMRINMTHGSGMMMAHHSFKDSATAQKHLDHVAGWSPDIFEDIQVATRTYDEDGNVSYHDGMKFRDLIAEVGKPVRQTSFATAEKDEEGTLYEVTATWEAPDSYNHVLRVTITYDKKSGLITAKDVY